MFFIVLIFAVHISLVAPYSVAPRATCNILVPDLSPQPVVVSYNALEFLYPEPEESELNLNAGVSTIISCSGGTLSFNSTNLGTTITATCQSGKNFIINGKTINFNDIVCSRNPYHTARYTGKDCEQNGREIEVGFILDRDGFAREMSICFDYGNLTSLYSLFDLTRSIGHQETGVPRPSFVEDNFYNLDRKVNDLYVRNAQKATINGLLGLPANSTKYIEDNSDYYLARGHLTAKTDYVYSNQQRATFHYVNAAPQWQTFNNGNWNTAEMNLKRYAESRRLDLKVYTGTYGVTTLPHEVTGKDVPLYLYVGSGGRKALPVPELYWKVIYDPNSKLGIALLGLNNPYQVYVSKSVICKDIEDSVTWLTWKHSDTKAGYSYACTIDDLRQTIPYIPQFEVSGNFNANRKLRLCELMKTGPDAGEEIIKNLIEYKSVTIA